MSRPRTLRIASVSDFQLPFALPDAVAWAVRTIADWRPHVLVVNGDLLDIHGLGPSEGDEAPDVDLLDELRMGADTLAQLRSGISRGGARIFMHGNHEFRLARKLSNVPSYLRSATRIESVMGCDEYRKWHTVPYRKHADGCYRVGPMIFFHGSRTGQNGNALEACEIARIKDKAYHGQLVVFGHTHVPVDPTQCRRTQAIPIPLYYANTGCFCDSSRMEWTYKLDTSGWAPSVLLGTVTGDKWSAELARWDG